MHPRGRLQVKMSTHEGPEGRDHGVGRCLKGRSPPKLLGLVLTQD